MTGSHSTYTNDVLRSLTTLDGKGRCFTETDRSSDHEVSGMTDIRSERRGLSSLLFQHGAGQQALVCARATRPVEVKGGYGDVASVSMVLYVLTNHKAYWRRANGGGGGGGGEEGDYVHIATLSPPEWRLH